MTHKDRQKSPQVTPTESPVQSGRQAGAQANGAVAPSSADDIARFLSAVRDLPPARAGQGRGRLAFALDATGSRQPTWTLACDIQADMFAAAASHGGLDMQIVYYRGHDECRASPFVADAATLGRLMRRISCEGGLTQIHRVLGHLGQEAERSGLKAAVFVGDAMEEDAHRLAEAAGQLALRGVRLFMFQEGDDGRVEDTFRALARITGGAWFRFDARAPHELRQLLAAVAAYAAGGAPALEARRDAGARRLIAALGR
ncbi:VWA domain-containing protein [Xanthobacter sp. V3C-3]|uniref:VWA domain-containing protein n=1 Tax=Xanthobacter lutulentifluminis TaxID=3119935 RepID=UPI00372C37C0